MLYNPFNIVSEFEKEIANYCGSPYAVAVDCCTNGIKMCCLYHNVKDKEEIVIPLRTYISIPQAIIQAGGKVAFRDYEWSGIYQLEPTPIYDAAKRLTKGMYKPGCDMVLSLHIKKTLAVGRGGIVLTDNKNLVDFLQKMRYEGRTPGVDYKVDPIEMCGFNNYMTPVDAARGLYLMIALDDYNPDQTEPNGYPDLSQYPVFKDCRKIL